jgi:hypothetical protein
MRYASGTCKHCPAQTEHISGGFVHSDTRQVHSKVNGFHVANPSYDNRTPGAERQFRVAYASRGFTVTARSAEEASNVAYATWGEWPASVDVLGSVSA